MLIQVFVAKIDGNYDFILQFVNHRLQFFMDPEFIFGFP